MAGSVEGLVKGSSYLLLSNAITSGLGALFWIIVAPLIGGEGVGYASSAISLSLLVGSLLGLGQNFSVLRLVPVYGSSAFLASVTVSTALGAAAGFVSYRVSALLFDGSLYPLASLVAVLSFLGVVSQSSLVGLVALRSERTYMLVVAASQATRLGLGAPLAFLIGVEGVLYAYALSMTVSLVSSSLIVFSRLGLATRKVAGLALEALKVGVSNYPNILAAGLIIHVAVLSTALVSRDPGVTGGFYIALNLGLVVSMIPNAVSMASLPRLSLDPSFRVWPLWRASMGLMAPVVALMMAMPGEVLSVFGEEFAGSSAELFVILLSSPLAAGVTFRLVELNARGMYSTVFAMGASRLGSMLVLIPLLGGLGGAVGIAAAYTISLVPSMLLSWNPRMYNASLIVSLIAVVSTMAGTLAGSLAYQWAGTALAEALARGLAAASLSLLLSLASKLVTSRELRFIARTVYGEFLSKPLGIIRGLGLEAIGRGFIIGFMALLVLAAVQLSMGEEEVANKLAEYAYYLLVAGVVVLLVDTIRSPQEEEETSVPQN
ncbi:MAG: hypothetical protein LRS43_01890 [Desulfurococcales archaeon]|nr:hypothetical protein [Desulfurococcales archaeon]